MPAKPWPLLAAALLLAACGGADAADPYDGSVRLPAERAFPDGLAVDLTEGTYFVASADDGAVWRGRLEAEGFDGDPEVFLAPGTDGRAEARGLALAEGVLWVAGGASGRAFAYDAATGALLARFEPVVGDSAALTGVAALPGRSALFSDARRPVLFRAALDGPPRLEPWLHLAATPVRYRGTENLAGLAATADGGAVFAAQTGLGRLFRVGVADRSVREVTLRGDGGEAGGGRPPGPSRGAFDADSTGLLERPYGLAFWSPDTLLVGTAAGVVPVRLDGDEGTLGAPVRDGRLGGASGVAAAPRRTLLVADGRLRGLRERGEPEEPFALLRYRLLPDSLRAGG